MIHVHYVKSEHQIKKILLILFNKVCKIDCKIAAWIMSVGEKSVDC